MASFNKFNRFVTDLALKVHNLDADTLKILLTNTAPVAGNAVKADLTEISAGNGYSAGGTDAAGVVTQNGATMELSGTDVVFTASGGTIGPFRYAVLYNDTPTSPADPLIGWWDYGSGVTLNSGETFTVDFGATVLTLS